MKNEDGSFSFHFRGICNPSITLFLEEEEQLDESRHLGHCQNVTSLVGQFLEIQFNQTDGKTPIEINGRIGFYISRYNLN